MMPTIAGTRLLSHGTMIFARHFGQCRRAIDASASDIELDGELFLLPLLIFELSFIFNISLRLCTNIVMRLLRFLGADGAREGSTDMSSRRKILSPPRLAAEAFLDKGRKAMMHSGAAPPADYATPDDTRCHRHASARKALF